MQQELTMMTVDNRTELDQVEGGTWMRCLGGIALGIMSGARTGSEFGPWGAAVGGGVGAIAGALSQCEWS